MSKKTIYNQYCPLNFDQINAFEGHYHPSMVKSYNNKTFAFWQRSLFQRACSTLDFTLPADWQGNTRDFFYYCLFRFGFLGIFYIPEFGYTFQPITLNGMGWYYQPTKAIVSNPNLPSGISQEFTIGKDIEVLKLSPDYMGIWDVITYHAEKLASLDNAINMSIINNKLAYVLGAKTKAAAEALKKVLDKINSGEPSVIVDYLLANDMKDKQMPFQFLERTNLKNNYITSDQLMDFQTILNRFDAEIGIPTLPYQKKERMVTDEATMRTIDGSARMITWKTTLESSLKVVNEHFGSQYGNIEVKFRYDPDELMKEGDQNEPVQNNS